MVKLLHRWPDLTEVERLDRYALQMVTNQHLSWRRRWAVRSIFPTAELPELAEHGDLAQLHAVRDDMWARLAKLPRRQRAVLVLRYYEQLTDPEIAELLGCAATTVRGYAHRALAALRVDLTSDGLASTEETQ